MSAADQSVVSCAGLVRLLLLVYVPDLADGDPSRSCWCVFCSCVPVKSKLLVWCSSLLICLESVADLWLVLCFKFAGILLVLVSDDIHSQIKNLSLCCALLLSAEASTSELLTWISKHLSMAANFAFKEIAKAYFTELDWDKSKRVAELGLDCSLMSDENKLVIDLMFELLPLLKNSIKTSTIDKLDDGDEIAAASARVPVAYAIVAAYQFKWFVMQVDYPHLGKLCFWAEIASIVLRVCLYFKSDVLVFLFVVLAAGLDLLMFKEKFGVLLGV